MAVAEAATLSQVAEIIPAPAAASWVLAFAISPRFY